MPCIVILVHGVNDVGEAYQNQEKGIIAGLSKRLNRPDLYAHEWKDFIMSHNEEAQQKICEPGRSPVIPFTGAISRLRMRSGVPTRNVIGMK